MDHCHHNPRSDKSKLMRFISPILVGLLLCVASAHAETPTVDAPAAETAPVVETDVGVIRIETEVSGLKVLVDGVLIGQTPLPGPWALKKGPHQVELKPPTGPSVLRTVNIEPRRTTVIAYGLVADPVTAQKKSPGTAMPFKVPPLTWRTSGLATAGAGLALVVAGAIYGIQAQATAEEASALDRSIHTRVRFDDLVDRTESSANMSNVLVGLGLAAILGGTSMNLFMEDGPLAPSSKAGGQKPAAPKAVGQVSP